MISYDNYRSVMADGHSSDTSDRFTFIPTTRVIDIMATQNWFPTKVTEKATRKPEKKGFQTHIVRFRQPQQNQAIVVGDIVPEIVMKNAHDGTSVFAFMAGLFRFVCTNGMVVADSMFESYKVKHIGFQDQNVIDAVYSVINSTPRIMDRVSEFKEIVLDTAEQKVFAESALIAKYGQEEEGKELIKSYNFDSLIRPIRGADRITSNGENTPWNTFNVLQEKLVEKGGNFGVKQMKNSSFVKTHTKVRAVRSVTEGLRINQALWNLTEKFAMLKSN